MLALAVGIAVTVFAADEPANGTAPAAPIGTAAPAGTAASAGTAPSAGTTIQAAETNLQTVEWILSLPPEKLTALRKALQNVEAMPQAERDALRLEIQNLRNSIVAFNQDNRADVMQLSQPDRSVLQQYLLKLHPNDVQALDTQMQNAKTPEARKAILDGVLKTAADWGIKPESPNRGGPGGPRGNPPPGTRGGRGSGGTGGRDGGRNGRGPRSPMPPPAPLPPPAT